jgi:hypothetical protein
MSSSNVATTSDTGTGNPEALAAGPVVKAEAPKNITVSKSAVAAPDAVTEEKFPGTLHSYGSHGLSFLRFTEGSQQKTGRISKYVDPSQGKWY